MSKKICCLIKDAIKNGYELRRFCQGGGYAINSKLIHALDTRSTLKDPLLFRDRFIGEDVMATVLCYAEGYKAQDFNSPNEPFAVIDSGIPRSVESLIEEKRSIIHSVKDAKNQKEKKIRNKFRKRRRG
jgi:hypothetical protein